MNTEKAYRIIDAFEAWLNGSVPYEAVNPDQTMEDVAAIRERYVELKWDISFSDAARIAKVEFIMRVVEEK